MSHSSKPSKDHLLTYWKNHSLISPYPIGCTTIISLDACSLCDCVSVGPLHPCVHTADYFILGKFPWRSPIPPPPTPILQMKNWSPELWLCLGSHNYMLEKLEPEPIIIITNKAFSPNSTSLRNTRVIHSKHHEVFSVIHVTVEDEADPLMRIWVKVIHLKCVHRRNQ